MLPNEVLYWQLIVLCLSDMILYYIILYYKKHAQLTQRKGREINLLLNTLVRYYFIYLGIVLPIEPIFSTQGVVLKCCKTCVSFIGTNYVH